MFEPQDHPDDIPYPGGPPTRPYDNAGWTLAYQMGVKFDRVLDGFDGPFEKLNGLQKPAPGKVTTTATAGYTFSHATNDSFIAINRLLAAGEDVELDVVRSADRGLLRRRQGVDAATVGKLAADLGLNFEACRSAARRRRHQAAQAAHRAGRSVRRLDALGLDALAARAVRVSVRGRVSEGARRRAISPAGTTSSSSRPASDRRPVAAAAGAAAAVAAAAARGGGAGAPNIPPEYQSQQGAYTAAQTGPQLKKFLEDGGTILAVGRSAMNLAELMAAAGRQPSRRTVAGRHRAAAAVEKVLRAGIGAARRGRQHVADRARHHQPGRRVLRQQPGLPARAGGGAEGRSARSRGSTARRRCAAAGRTGRATCRAASRSSTRRSGRASCSSSAPEITFRAQPHGTFKFLFNGIYLAARAPGPGRRPTAHADRGQVRARVRSKRQSRVAMVSRPGFSAVRMRAAGPRSAALACGLLLGRLALRADSLR